MEELKEGDKVVYIGPESYLEDFPRKGDTFWVTYVSKVLDSSKYPSVDIESKYYSDEIVTYKKYLIKHTKLLELLYSTGT